MTDSSSPTIFANRYRFEPVDDDWETGRSGYTHLVFDIKKERLGVLKRAETKSQPAIERLKNEINALNTLRGLGVPEIYETGEAVYGSKSYLYMVIEYIEGIRIEQDLSTLRLPERAEILTQFFSILSQAHRKGIVNGDIDIKHLFWQPEKKQLIIIDWGNAILNVDRKKKIDFAYDLARSAEIIYSLVTKQAHLPATGSIALPTDTVLKLKSTPLPKEFRELCKWAPRTPIESTQAPYTSLELFEVARLWRSTINEFKPKEAHSPKRPYLSIILISILLGLIAIGYMFYSDTLHLPLAFLRTPTTTVLRTSTATSTNPIPTKTPVTSTQVPTLTPVTASSITPTQASATSIALPVLTAISSSTTIPVPAEYSPFLVFDNKLKGKPALESCWPKPTDKIFTRRDDGYWRFAVEKDQPLDEAVFKDFGQCISTDQWGALGLNLWVARLEAERSFD